MRNSINFHRMNNDVNGNPRYVCHYLDFKPNNYEGSFSYDEALKDAKSLGGKKFHNKKFGGGVIFQSYNLEGLIEKILISTNKAIEYKRKPNNYELKFGYGATHYRTFLIKDVLNRKGELKKWFKCKDDNLNYSRS